MILRRIRLPLAGALALIAALPLSAQVEVLLGDESHRQRPVVSQVPVAHGNLGSQRTTALTLPFVDDFSTGTVPDDAKWSYGAEGRHPLVSDAKGLHAPSKGVATFEGTTSGGVKYDPDDAASGLADSLASQAIDLSAHSPADSVYLSFFLQPGGLGDKPEATDSFVVFFDTTGNFSYTRVLTIKGTDLPNGSFSQVLMPVRDPLYFHANFRFKFVGYGSLNGENDQWHLDYVRMGTGRNANDTLLNDVSVTAFADHVLGDYSAMPLDQWDAIARMSPFGVEVSNLKGSASSATVTVSITDATGNNTFSGTTLVSSPSISVPAVGHDNAALSALGEQTLAEVARIRATATVSGGGDIATNDVMVRDYPIDSVMALDDGVADMGYGLTVARSFCQEFETAEKDTLTGVMIRFTPAIYVSPIGQVTDLDNKGFRLVVWDHLHPDSVLTSVSSGMNVDYGDSLNQFHYYELLTRVPITGKFWVGIEQVDGMPIGVGFDKNHDNSSKVYYADATGGFTNTTNKGTLMIRPVFSNYVFVSKDDAVQGSSPSLSVWPNPVTGEELNLMVRGDWSSNGSEAVITDLAGKVVWTQALPQGQRWSLAKPTLPEGIYFLSLRAEGRSLTTKLIW